MYCIVHYVDEPAKQLIQETIDETRKNFNTFDVRGIEVHFTLKYTFQKESLQIVESICESLSTSFQTGSYEIGSIDTFSKDTIFLSVNLDTVSQHIYDKLFTRCKEENIPFKDHEKDGIHFHISLAQKAREKFDNIMTSLEGKDFKTTQKFSNLTILRFTGEKFVMHKQYSLKNRT